MQDDKSKKIFNNKTGEITKNNRDRKDNKKEKKVHEDTHLTYNIEDKLDLLFPQFKPSKKKEDTK